MSDSRYQARGVSAGKEDVHQAIQNIDKGLFPKAFCKIVPDYLTGDDKKVEAGFGIFLCLTGNGELVFENAGSLGIKAGDAIVVPYSAGSFTVNNCAGILSRPPAA